jgi:hypothetical protein
VKGALKEFLAGHPKLVSALFTLTVLLTKVGAVIADEGCGHSGH